MRDRPAPIDRLAAGFMTILEFNDILGSDRRAEGYLLKRCRAKSIPRCPSCGHERLYVIEGGKRRRCARCRHSFPPFAGTWLNKTKISPREWLWVIKLFQFGMPATTIAEETGISYPTILKALDIIRTAIARNASDDAGKREEDPRGSAIYGMSRRDGQDATFERIDDDLVLLKIILSGGRLVLADKSIDFPRLSWSGCTLEIGDLGKRYPHCKVYCSEKGFWPYSKERLITHHGVSLDDLPLHLMEIDFRWTNRRGALFEAIIELLCDAATAPAIQKARTLAAAE